MVWCTSVTHPQCFSSTFFSTDWTRTTLFCITFTCWIFKHVSNIILMSCIAQRVINTYCVLHVTWRSHIFTYVLQLKLRKLISQQPLSTQLRQFISGVPHMSVRCSEIFEARGQDLKNVIFGNQEVSLENLYLIHSLTNFLQIKLDSQPIKASVKPLWPLDKWHRHAFAMRCFWKVREVKLITLYLIRFLMDSLQPELEFKPFEASFSSL